MSPHIHIYNWYVTYALFGQQCKEESPFCLENMSVLNVIQSFPTELFIDWRVIVFYQKLWEKIQVPWQVSQNCGSKTSLYSLIKLTQTTSVM